jgi:hypothetical protein
MRSSGRCWQLGSGTPKKEEQELSLHAQSIEAWSEMQAEDGHRHFAANRTDPEAEARAEQVEQVEVSAQSREVSLRSWGSS